MDVTSLLNANAAEQQKKAEAAKTIPTRNRTPWDAGGYSLPINTLSNFKTTSLAPDTRPSTPPQSAHRKSQDHDNTMEYPSSPRHKPSDSRSSQSSYASSSQSASHSRFSSLSTVGSLQQTSSVSDAAFGSKHQSMDLGSSSLSTVEVSRPSAGTSRRHGSVSPTASMEALVLAAEEHSVNLLRSISRKLSLEDTNMSRISEKPSISSLSEFVPCHRPSSPSDAILIKRSMLPSLRVNTGDQEPRASDDVNINQNYLSAPLASHSHCHINIRGHKRALSAPDFSGLHIGNFEMCEPSHNDLTSLGPHTNPTPPMSIHPDSDSPPSPSGSAGARPDTPPSNITDFIAGSGLKCMFVEDCTTGSQLRKTVSHIFGRNKMCTRLIPDEIWVHYCRKHYQRSRYRDPKRFANVQSDLVLQQINLIHEWSESNRKNGNPGVVESWGLAVRKREQKRLDDLTSSRKRNASTLEDEIETQIGSNGAQPHTAVPSWLLQITGKGYTTDQMRQITERLRNDILSSQHMSFPDIEILPNIIVDQDEPKSPKGYTKRSSVGMGHKRAQSLGAAMKSDFSASNRRSSHPAIWSQDGSPVAGSAYGSAIQKRRRGNDMSEENSPILPGRGFMERPLEMSRRFAFPQQSMYDIDEHSASNGYMPQAPLPAPTPQRLGGQTMASHLENSQYQHSRRPAHQRSQSDVGAFTRGRSGYPPTPSSVYMPEMQDQYGRSPFHDQPHIGQSFASLQPRWEPFTPQQPPQNAYQQRPMGQQYQGPPSVGHHRFNSSPMISSLYGPSGQQHFGNPSAYPLPPVPHLVEAQQSRDGYSRH